MATKALSAGGWVLQLNVLPLYGARRLACETPVTVYRRVEILTQANNLKGECTYL